ncbi:MAG: hypothetical protein GWM92_17660 [Gemmatimonadetes bacterium]|nr:heavy-metal-associated domain-containing protein [Gemmatimonadota bacterium]NIR78204.1 heavy-metal-associated domain-containing protein [Gemmatimonadota bacterium]NIT89387.1 heavy-metal-associated domain-containing protein [Gemmatimonadota bacterium]NIU30354.1 heavy-metal-associated domain-containing protein [Gemmatimonadota bacterium]NIU35239.1 hypothetical protein [Gemmatimonadota bacterium]
MRELARSATGSLLAVAVGLALSTAPTVAQEQPEQTQQVRTIRVKILGMSCPFCAYGVEQKLKRLEGVNDLNVELQSGIATLTMSEGADVSNETLQRTVDEAGFEAAAIVRSFQSEYDDLNPEEITEGEGPAAATH